MQMTQLEQALFALEGNDLDAFADSQGVAALRH
jgi:hypothetical protein